VTINSDVNDIEIIIKLGPHEHMKALFDDGVVYMNTLEFYRTLEAHDERSDVNEGTEQVSNRTDGVLRWKNPKTNTFEEIAKLTHGRIRELNSNIQNLNVYCLYYLKSKMPIESVGAIIPQRTKVGFGEYAVVVADAGEFVTRIKKAAIDIGHRHFRSLVKYEDFSQEKLDVGPFVKDQAFSHQSELRVALYTGENSGSAIKLEIGSIEDIAVLVPSEDLNGISLADQG